MNLVKMLDMQKELDNYTLKRSNIIEYPLYQVKLALRVELGELAQEWKEFKYWKKSKGYIDLEKILEEYIDVLHFALSIYNNKNNNISKKHILDVIRLSNLYFKELDIYALYNLCFVTLKLECVIALGLKLGFTENDIEQGYYNKNKINWDRMRGNY